MVMPEITSGLQEGFCDLCKKDKLVRIIMSDGKTLSVCIECANGKLGDLSIDELINKYGKKIKP